MYAHISLTTYIYIYYFYIQLSYILLDAVRRLTGFAKLNGLTLKKSFDFKYMVRHKHPTYLNRWRNLQAYYIISCLVHKFKEYNYIPTIFVCERLPFVNSVTNYTVYYTLKTITRYPKDIPNVKHQ